MMQDCGFFPEGSFWGNGKDCSFFLLKNLWIIFCRVWFDLRCFCLSLIHIFLVTHDIGVAAAMADRLLVLKDGQEVEQGEAEQILRAPGEAYTRKLLAAVPRLRRRCV